MRKAKGEQTPRTEKEKKSRRRRVAAIVSLAVACSMLLGTIGFVYWDLMVKDGPGTDQNPTGYDTLPEDVDDEEPDPDFESLHDIDDATNLKGFLRSWWYNGGDEMIRYSNDVLNVLLMGIDDDQGAREHGTGRSDSMLLVSINKKTRMITMLSFLRDSYCYMNINGKEWYHRLNSSFHLGGPAGVMTALTHLYKIRVDKYITVNFASFPKLIDRLGGVTVEVTEKEAKYVNRTAPSQKRNFPVGPEAKLTGAQALIYSRIRKLDTDMARTNRQQKVIEAIIKSARSASLKQLYKALDDTLPYVNTNFTKAELLGLVPSAVNWLKFGITKTHSPVVDGPETSAIPGTINGMWIWIVDFPRAAQQVQLALYGETNIDLGDNAQRSAYINSIFRSAEQRTTRVHTTASKKTTTAAPPESHTAATETKPPHTTVPEVTVTEPPPPTEPPTEAPPPTTEQETTKRSSLIPWLTLPG